MTKLIFLTTGHAAVVDDDDYVWLSHWKWRLSINGYAVRSSGNGKAIFMHREVNKTPIGFETDHVNRNKLDT